MAKSEAKAKREGFIAFKQHVLHTHGRVGYRHARFKLFSYLDFPICFACYPPKSFKIIYLTCIWLKFVDTSFHSLQKKSEKHTTPRAKFSLNLNNHCVKLKTPRCWNQAHNWLNLLNSCGPNLGAIRSNAIFCEFYDLIVPQAPILSGPVNN